MRRVVEDNIGDPNFGDNVRIPLQWNPELTRDGVVVGKRLLQQLTGSKAPPWTVYLGWSGSGETAAVLSMGRVVGPLRMRPGPAPYNGGTSTASTTRPPAVATTLSCPSARVGPSSRSKATTSGASPRSTTGSPFGAPSVWIGGDLDGLGLGLSGVVYANKVARALPGSALAGTPIEHLIATYDLTNVPHATHDSVFMNERRHGTENALRYERIGSYPDDSGFNTDDRGELVQPIAVAEDVAQPGIFEDDWAWRFSLDIPRTTPLFLQTIENLHGLTTRGAPLPVSRIETRLFGRLDEVDADTPYPLVPTPCPTLEWTDENPHVIGQAMESCAPTITADAQLAVRFPWGEETPTRLEQNKGTDRSGYSPAPINEARWFVEHNPLPHVVDSIEVPDVAAALGPVLLFGQRVLGRRLTDAQLRAGFVAGDGRVYRYADHNAWVSVFRDATSSLIAAGLWDRAMGHQYDVQAQRSDVLR